MPIMSLVGYLEQPNWQDVLRRSFTTAIAILQTDRFRLTSSAVEDIKSWLTSGGTPHALRQLQHQMDLRRLPPERQAEVRAAMLQLIREHQRQLLDLMAAGVIPAKSEAIVQVCSLSEAQFTDLWEAMRRGDWSWEGTMRAQGYPEDAIEGLRRAIDRWLAEQRPPAADASLN
jgi:hypothetical protein